MEKLILHIGVGKTGTSAIQAFLAKNVNELKNKGIIYPNHISFDNAKQGKVTSGNGDFLVYYLNEDQKHYLYNPKQEKTILKQSILQQLEADLKLSEGKHLLYSNEDLCTFKLDGLKKIKELAGKYSKQIHIIIYLRNIADHAFSSYIQRVKQNSCKGSFSNYLKEVYFVKMIMWNALNELKQIEAETIIDVRHYDSVKHNIINDFLDVLDIKERDTLNCETGVVNRSLTRNELKFIQKLNKFTDGIYPSIFISNSLSNRLPDEKYVLQITEDEFNLIKSHFNEKLPIMNQIFPLNHPIMLKSTNMQITSGSTESNSNEVEYLTASMAFTIENFHQDITNLMAGIKTLNQEIVNLQKQITELKQTRDNSLIELEKVYASTSWQISKPIRVLAKLKQYFSKQKRTITQGVK